MKKINKKQKLKELSEKFEETQTKLARKRIGHRGVRHENAASELRDMEIRVLEAHEFSLFKEIKVLKEELGIK